MSTYSALFSFFRRTTRRLATLAISISVVIGPTAQAAIDELVTTTARGRAEAVQDVPATVAVISQDQIENLGIARVEDFVNLVPGVTLVQAAETGDTQINIRGINGARDAESNIALVIDGILMTDRAAVNREYTNLQQIEIMKGPQGALYGRNAAAGAILISTQKPGEEFGMSLKGSAAEDSSYRLLGNLNGPIGDNLGWSVGGDWRTSDGYYKDWKGTEGVTDQFESYNVDGRLVWDVTDNWALDLKGRYGEVDAASITFNSVFHLPDLANAPISGFYENVNDHSFQFNPNVLSYNNQEATELSLRSQTDFGWGELTAWGLYSNIDNNLGADGTSAAFGFFNDEPRCESTTLAENQAGNEFALNPPQKIGTVPESVFTTPDFSGSIFGAYTPTSCDGTQFQQRNQENYSFEVRLQSDGDQSVRWGVGLYYLNIDRSVGVNTGIDSNNQVLEQLYVPNNGQSGATNATEQLVSDQFDTNVYAFFGQLAFDITDSLELFFALRYDQEKRKAKSLVPTVADGATAEFITCAGPGQPANAPFTDPINPGLCPDINPSGQFTPREATFEETQPKVALTWDIFPTLTAFASAGVGFKSGGFNNQGSQATIDKYINSNPSIQDGTFTPVLIEDSYKKETSTSYELGFKSYIGDNLRWEGAIYRIDVDDMQFFEFVVGPFGLLRVNSNIDEVKIEGVELTGVWSPVDWLNLYGGGNLIGSDIKKNTARADTIGNSSPYTPDWTLNFGGDVVAPITGGLNLIASLNLTGIGETWFHVVQNQLRPTGFGFNGGYDVARRDDYWLANARLGVGGDNWSIVAFGNNLGDKKWLQEVIPAPEFGGSFIHPGTLSRYGVEATYNF